MWDVPIDAVRLPLWQKYDLVMEEGIFLPLPKVDVGMLKVLPGHSLRNQLISCLTGQTRRSIME